MHWTPSYIQYSIRLKLSKAMHRSAAKNLHSKCTSTGYVHVIAVTGLSFIAAVFRSTSMTYLFSCRARVFVGQYHTIQIKRSRLSIVRCNFDQVCAVHNKQLAGSQSKCEWEKIRCKGFRTSTKTSRDNDQRHILGLLLNIFIRTIAPYWSLVDYSRVLCHAFSWNKEHWRMQVNAPWQ